MQIVLVRTIKQYFIGLRLENSVNLKIKLLSSPILFELILPRFSLIVLIYLTSHKLPSIRVCSSNRINRYVVRIWWFIFIYVPERGRIRPREIIIKWRTCFWWSLDKLFECLEIEKLLVNRQNRTVDLLQKKLLL